MAAADVPGATKGLLLIFTLFTLVHVTHSLESKQNLVKMNTVNKLCLFLRFCIIMQEIIQAHTFSTIAEQIQNFEKEK